MPEDLHEGAQISRKQSALAWLLRLATPLIVAGAMFYGDQRYVTHAKLDDRMKPVTEHIADTGVHMPYREKLKEFVSRREYEQREDAIKETLVEIKATLIRMEEKMEKNRP